MDIVSDHDEALIEKVAAAIYDNAAEPTGVKARAVLDAVADDLRRGVVECAFCDEAATDACEADVAADAQAFRAEQAEAALSRVLADVEALADEWMSYSPSPWDEPATELRELVAEFRDRT